MTFIECADAEIGNYFLSFYLHKFKSLIYRDFNEKLIFLDPDMDPERNCVSGLDEK